ncbi:MAG TPA: hypothetical protein PKD09_07635 [Aggregatilinea sp.]|uniref:hypothetical protein n=1 Tax=Aggregatilinea sp. TaxID=2806333 RepID=UPI002B9DF1A8|nr:hypothetical protein [Aggregatilinea sp.]HML21500.1 hypothetical protein [Aggregatilinea sp.]
MTFDEILKARVHRILEPLERYENAPDVTLIQKLKNELVVSEGEEILGVYRSGAGGAEHMIAVTMSGLHVYHGNWIHLEYSEMTSAKVPLEDTDKANASTILVNLKSGDVVSIPIVGGQGKLRDVWPFLRFIQRVIGDYHARHV